MGAETFEIVVRGTLSLSLVAALNGFTVNRIEHGMTHLVGPVLDQAQLLGVLEGLRDLTIELISVNRVTPESAQAPLGHDMEESTND